MNEILNFIVSAVVLILAGGLTTFFVVLNVEKQNRRIKEYEQRNNE